MFARFIGCDVTECVQDMCRNEHSWCDHSVFFFYPCLYFFGCLSVMNSDSNNDEHHEHHAGRKRLRATQACVICRKKKASGRLSCSRTPPCQLTHTVVYRSSATAPNPSAITVETPIRNANTQRAKNVGQGKDMSKCWRNDSHKWNDVSFNLVVLPHYRSSLKLISITVQAREMDVVQSRV